MNKIVTHVVIPALVLAAIATGVTVAQSPKRNLPIGSLETLIVDRADIALNLDVDRLNGLTRETASPATMLRFHAAPDSFFQLLAYNDELRGATGGSIVLVPANSALLPSALNASFNRLSIEPMSSDVLDLVIRDSKTGFVFFTLEGIDYRYDAAARTIDMINGRLVITEAFAKELGRPSDAGTIVGSVSVSAGLRVIETQKIVNGEVETAMFPPIDVPDAVPGPDVIVGDLPNMVQVSSVAGQVSLAIGTTSCNNGTVELNWFAMPNTDHPIITQNFYRLSANGDRIEQIGQSWLKHGFQALQQNACSFGCSPSGTGTKLGVGCSDPYSTGNNSNQNSFGARAWANPFTGAFPNTARDHAGHTHNGLSHLLIVNASDLSTAANAGAAYFAETQYVTPHEYAWCQSHPGECNMYNNTSYRRFNVTGTSNFTFAANGTTVRTTPVVMAWPGATVNTIEPAPGVDGRGLIAYKVSGPVNGVYHYEYAINNYNLDRAIQSFSVPLGCATEITNVGFRAPMNEPGSANDGTGGGGISNAPWTATQTAGSISWASETVAQNPNANALRWGLMFNYRFDSTRPPQPALATIGFFKTGEPITVAIQAPSPGCNALAAVSAVSRKTHGAAGVFDINLPLGDTPGVESRRSANGGHTIVLTFTNEVVSGNAAVTEGTGSIAGSPTFSGNTMTIPVTGVPASQRIAITLSGVTDSFSQTMADLVVPMKAIFGDTDGNSGVSASDIGRVKSHAGNAVTEANFRSDVTADGAVTASDIGAVKSMAGTTLP